ncbi:MAG: response regulator, partial [Verrucomicrobia bacterium]|nr:response regulator [Verrucomicrobiota bacterium]
MHPTLIPDRTSSYDSMDVTPHETNPSPPVDLNDRPKLLIVDDEEGPRESLRMVFKDEYRVRIAASAKDALAILEAEKVDVAILDIRMPEITGLDLLEKVRILDPSIEVVMLTAYETPDYLRKALQLRACDYLNKPFDVPNIRSVVANAVTRRSAQQQAQSNIAQLTEIREQLQQLRVKEETMRTRWEIYASIIHDINSPLTIISGLVQLVNQRINQDQPLQTEDVEVMKDRMKR